MGPGAGIEHGGGGTTVRQSLLTGGYYWFPTPGHPTISWEVVTCQELGFDAEVGHVKLWVAVIERLAVAWGKDVAVLRRLVKDHCYGLPRGRVARWGKRFLVNHGNDSPCPDRLEPVLVAFRLDRRSVRVTFDEHERMLPEDRRRVNGKIFTVNAD